MTDIKKTKNGRTIVGGKWIFADPVAQAKARVEAAQAELAAAGKALLDAMNATPEELTNAADALSDIHHEAEAEGWAGAEWNQMLAGMVADERAAEAEDK